MDYFTGYIEAQQKITLYVKPIYSRKLAKIYRRINLRHRRFRGKKLDENTHSEHRRTKDRQKIGSDFLDNDKMREWQHNNMNRFYQKFEAKLFAYGLCRNI